MAYVLGWLFTDGCIYRSGRVGDNYRVALSIIDYDMLERIKGWIGCAILLPIKTEGLLSEYNVAVIDRRFSHATS